MASEPAEPEGKGQRNRYEYVVMAYDSPPVQPGEELLQREDLKLIGVFEAPTHEEACDLAAEQFPPRVGEQRTFAATLASKWREFDYGTETRVETKGHEAQTHPSKGFKPEAEAVVEAAGAAQNAGEVPPEPGADAPSAGMTVSDLPSPDDVEL